MAEDRGSKTEAPTPKRIGQAREKGQVAVSREVTTLFVLGAGTAALLVILPWSLAPTMRLMRNLVERPDTIAIGTAQDLSTLLFEIAANVGVAMLPALGLLLVAACGGTLLQTGFLWAVARLAPNFSVLNPANGVERLFSGRALVEFGRGLVKLAIVAAIAWVILRPDLDSIGLMVGIDAHSMLAVLGGATRRLLFAVLAAVGALAAIDFFYQRWSVMQSLRMSKEEVKEEFKNLEGDPHIKGHIRKLRATRARRRMMAAVPQASVVITNPTHYAVALRYEMKAMSAPVVVAKGADLIARRIREIAAEHDVPQVENPPLARTLYATVEIDEEIPPEHYKAVAEIIGYVMRLKRRPAVVTRQPPPA